MHNSSADMSVSLLYGDFMICLQYQCVMYIYIYILYVLITIGKTCINER